MFCVSQKLNLAFYCFQSSQLSTHRHTRLSAISLETWIISVVCSPDLCKQFTTKRFIIITLPLPVCVQMPSYKATAIRASVHSTCSHTINHKHDRGWCKLSFFNRYKYCLRVAPKQFLNYKKCHTYLQIFIHSFRFLIIWYFSDPPLRFSGEFDPEEFLFVHLILWDQGQPRNMCWGQSSISSVTVTTLAAQTKYSCFLSWLQPTGVVLSRSRRL